MTKIVETVMDVYNGFLDTKNTRNTWTLICVFLTVAMYVLFVKYIGPLWMQRKEPFDLRRIMFFYNTIMFTVTIYFLGDVIILLLNEKELGFCKVGSEDSPVILRIAEVGWWLLGSKICELFETVFFVLRKKSDQINDTHILHHALMPFVIWLMFQIEHNGPLVYAALINSTVHTTIYFYHGLACLGPSLQKYLWWKKYLTYLNIAHLLLIVVGIIASSMLNCKTSKALHSLTIFICTLFLVLFVIYFRNTYKTTQSLRRERNVDTMTHHSNATTGKTKLSPFSSNDHQLSITKTD